MYNDKEESILLLSLSLGSYKYILQLTRIFIKISYSSFWSALSLYFLKSAQYTCHKNCDIVCTSMGIGPFDQVVHTLLMAVSFDNLCILTLTYHPPQAICAEYQA